MSAVVGKKLGMSRIFKEDGTVIPVTLVQIYDGCVSSRTNNSEKGFDTMTISFDKAGKPEKVSKPVRMSYEKSGLAVYKKKFGVRIAKEDEYKVGDAIDVNMVEIGDFIHAVGTSIGKGFAGVMKRHNFGGLEATHGVSISHRSHGSTGQCQDPGKVFKGKKMAGHMGAKRTTVKNLEVVNIDKEDKIIFIKGSVPGSKGSDVVIKLFTVEGDK